MPQSLLLLHVFREELVHDRKVPIAIALEMWKEERYIGVL